MTMKQMATHAAPDWSAVRTTRAISDNSTRTTTLLTIIIMTKVLVSGPSQITAPTVVINATNRVIEMVWINHKGEEVSYGPLEVMKRKGLKTFIGHPWIFFVKGTRVRLTVHSPFRLPADVLWPATHPPTSDGRPRYFTVAIAFPSLRDVCYQSLRDSGVTDDVMNQLPLPDSLKYDYKFYWSSSCSDPKTE